VWSIGINSTLPEFKTRGPSCPHTAEWVQVRRAEAASRSPPRSRAVRKPDRRAHGPSSCAALSFDSGSVSDQILPAIRTVSGPSSWWRRHLLEPPARPSPTGIALEPVLRSAPARAACTRRRRASASPLDQVSATVSSQACCRRPGEQPNSVRPSANSIGQFSSCNHHLPARGTVAQCRTLSRCRLIFAGAETADSHVAPRAGRGLSPDQARRPGAVSDGS